MKKLTDPQTKGLTYYREITDKVVKANRTVRKSPVPQVEAKLIELGLLERVPWVWIDYKGWAVQDARTVITDAGRAALTEKVA